MIRIWRNPGETIFPTDGRGPDGMLAEIGPSGRRTGTAQPGWEGARGAGDHRGAGAGDRPVLPAPRRSPRPPRRCRRNTRGYGVQPPNQRALASMRQFANARTRQGKAAGPPDFARLLPGGSSPRAARNSADCASSRAPSGGGTSGIQTRADAGSRAGARAEMDRMAAQLALRGMLTHAQERAAMLP